MFFYFLPVGVDYKAERYPVVTFTIMGLCTAIWLVTLLLRLACGEAVDEWVFEQLWLVPAAAHPWSFITSMFVHADFFHLLGNMIYLFLFGSCVEDTLGRLRFSFFYLVGGIVAELLHIVCSVGHFSSIIPLGGASGAISACIGAFLIFFARTRIEFKWVIFFIFRFWNGEFFFPAWLVISFWFANDLLGVVLSMIGDSAGGGVAFAAHVGGTLAGLGWGAFEKWRLANMASREAAEEYAAAVAAEVAATEAALETADIHLHINGAAAGPFTRSQVREMLAMGSVPDDASYWLSGMEDWRTVEELRDLIGWPASEPATPTS